MFKNHGVNVIWFQNEGMFPAMTILSNIVKKFKKVNVFFDNDRAGIEASRNLVNRINNYQSNKAVNIAIPLNEGVKDISDFIEKKGVYELKRFLNKCKI